MRLVSLSLAAAIAATGLAGCTPAEQSAALTGISAACTVAAIGSTIAVDVAVPGSPGAVIGSKIGSIGAAECPAIVAGAQSLINQATASGQTAVATVTVTAPSGTVSLRRRVMVRRGAAAPGASVSYSYTIMPGGFGSLSGIFGGL